MANKEIQLHDANGDTLIPVTCLSSIFVLNEDGTTQALDDYIKDLIATAKREAISTAETNTLTTLGASATDTMVTFSKTICYGTVEEAVCNS